MPLEGKRGELLERTEEGTLLEPRASLPLELEERSFGFGSGVYMPCLLALCVLRKYLLQNSLLHSSQYASGLKMRSVAAAAAAAAAEELVAEDTPFNIALLDW